jgi:hypothetical protein
LNEDRKYPLGSLASRTHEPFASDRPRQLIDCDTETDFDAASEDARERTSESNIPSRSRVRTTGRPVALRVRLESLVLGDPVPLVRWGTSGSSSIAISTPERISLSDARPNPVSVSVSVAFPFPFPFPVLIALPHPVDLLAVACTIVTSLTAPP